MQFMPATFAAYGVDGDGDGRDQHHQRRRLGVLRGELPHPVRGHQGRTGVRAALFAYNHATWYVNDVLHYAHAYGGGTVLGDPTTCPVAQAGNPTHAPLARATVANVLDWATSQTGDRYVFGANGPDAWDCSSFTQAAYRRAGLNLPRTAGAQRDWLAAGHGTRIPPGQRTPRRPDLLGLLPRPQRHRARRHRRRPQGPHHHRGQEPPRRRRQLHLHPHRAHHPRDLAAQCHHRGTGMTTDPARSQPDIVALVNSDIDAAVRDAAHHTSSPYVAAGRLEHNLTPLRERLALLAHRRPELLDTLAAHFGVTGTDDRPRHGGGASRPRAARAHPRGARCDS